MVSKGTSVACARNLKGAQRCNQLKGGAWKMDTHCKLHQMGRHLACDARRNASNADTLIKNTNNFPVATLTPLLLIVVVVLEEEEEEEEEEEIVTFGDASKTDGGFFPILVILILAASCCFSCSSISICSIAVPILSHCTHLLESLLCC
jgi:hypothetical protein